MLYMSRNYLFNHKITPIRPRGGKEIKGLKNPCNCGKQENTCYGLGNKKQQVTIGPEKKQKYMLSSCDSIRNRVETALPDTF